MTRTRTDTKPHRDHHDNQQRHTAALIQRDHPGWLVIYGPWSRLFWAFGTLPAPPRQAIILSAPGPNHLAAQIRHAERSRPTGPRRHDDQARAGSQ